MSWDRGTRFVLASVAIHAIGGIALLAIRHPPLHRPNRTVTVDVRKKEPAPLVAAAPIQRPPEQRPTTPPPSSKNPPPAHPLRPTTPPPLTPPPVAPPPLTPPPPATAQNPPPSAQPAKRIDLFNQRAIETAVGGTGIVVPVVPGDKRGRTLSAANGAADPNIRDTTADREGAAGVIGDVVSNARSESDLKSRVPERWREIERIAQRDFHPKTDIVSDDGVVGGFLKGWMHSAAAQTSAGRGDDDSRSSFNGMGGAGAGAQMQRDIDSRTSTEVEITMAPSGEIVSAKVVRASGRRKFDQEALEMVKKTCTAGGALEGEKGNVTTRWRVQAWVDVKAPSPTLGFSFDESTGKVGGAYPGQKKVKTSVTLIRFIAQR